MGLKEEVLKKVTRTHKSALGIAMELTPLIDKEVEPAEDYNMTKLFLRSYRWKTLKKIERILTSASKKGLIEREVLKVKTRIRAKLQNRFQLLGNKDLRGVGYRWTTKVAYYWKKQDEE